MPLPQRLTYPGDCAATLLHRILGPDTAGGYMTVVEAVYDPDAGVTRARVQPLMPDYTGWTFDAHGQAYATEVAK